MMAERYYRKVIKITGDDSPNVRLAKAEIRAGKQPSGKIILPGVLPWQDYEKRCATWDPIRVSIGIHAEFWEGAEVLMFPPSWLDRAHLLQFDLRTQMRTAKALGVDPAEGGDKSAYCVIDEFGVIELFSEKTPNTTQVRKTVRRLLKDHHLDAKNVLFDRGGGGQGHADTLREEGYPVRTIGFGEPVTIPNTRLNSVREHGKEERYVYKNRRAEMYGRIREFLDPNARREPRPGWFGFAIPPGYVELRRQLAPIPMLYDGEGRLYLPPKEKPYPDFEGVTLRSIIGHSPDEADALALALHCMGNVSKQIVIGGMPG